MVVLEVGMAMVLLVSAGLLLRSFAKMLEVDPGFEPAHLLTASLALPVHDYPTQQKVDDFLTNLQQRLEANPQVKSVGFSSNIPIVGQRSGRLIAPQGYTKSPGEGWIIASNYLTQGNYFEATRIPLIRGRYFTAADDDPKAPLVTVISQSLANRYFAGKDPIGMGIKVGPSFDSSMPTMTVVGVVGDIKQGARDQATVPQMYEPLGQAMADLGPYGAMIGVAGDMNIVVRAEGDPATLENMLNQTVRQLDPLLALSDMNTMDEIVAATESSRRFNTAMLTSFAAVALLLSLLGIYGVLAYSVTERTREIAIRMALGATRENVLLRTLSYALSLTAIGAAIGLAASIGMTRLLASLLYDTKPLDLPVMLAAIALLFLCTIYSRMAPRTPRRLRRTHAGPKSRLGQPLHRLLRGIFAPAFLATVFTRADGARFGTDLSFFSFRSFHAARNAPASKSSLAFASTTCVAPFRPHPPGMGRKTSGSASTNSACISGVIIRFP